MRQSHLEPGLIQVFRLYAWLQMTAFVIFPIFRILHNWIEDSSILQISPVAFMAIESSLLIGLLYSGRLHLWMRRWYIPAALSIATVGLILEQHLFSSIRAFWIALPFLNILIILIAWQYRFSHVVAFTLGITIFEIGLSWFFPTAFFIIRSTSSEGQVFTRVLADEWPIAIGFLITSSITGLVLGYVVTQLAKAHRLQREVLSEANLKLVRHAATLEQLATSRERVRLSHELHDTLAHTLSAQAVQIEALLTIGDHLPQKAQSILNQMKKTTLSGLDETRRTLSALRASPLEEMGLAAATKAFVEDFVARNNLILEEDIVDHLDDVPSEVEQCFYRTTQEALENIARHANAHKLSVSLTQRKNNLSMKISDDGRGFSILEVSNEKKLGLVVMRERAEMIRADLDVDSKPGAGTTVSLEWKGSP